MENDLKKGINEILRIKQQEVNVLFILNKNKNIFYIVNNFTQKKKVIFISKKKKYITFWLKNLTC